MKIPNSVYFSVAGLLLGGFYLSRTAFSLPQTQAIRPPAQQAFVHAIAGVGIVESKEKNVRIAPFYPGRVATVWAKENDSVCSGCPLYRLDTQQLESELSTQNAVISSSQAVLRRLERAPRPEDLPPLQAQVAAQQARVARLAEHVQRLSGVDDPRSVSQDTLSDQRHELAEAQAVLRKSQADLARLKAGTWQYELEEARQQLRVAQQRAQELRVSIGQATVTAPFAGRVLQVNVRPGEYVTPGGPEPTVLLGRSGKLQVRVDIDEVNASLVRPGQAAVAYLKGSSGQRFPLKFVRIEPYMTPKRSLTGDTAERNDVRVLQVIYEFDAPKFPVYVGQQVTVYLNRQPGGVS